MMVFHERSDSNSVFWLLKSEVNILLNIKMFSKELPVMEETIVQPAAVKISLQTQKHGPAEGSECLP